MKRGTTPDCTTSLIGGLRSIKNIQSKKLCYAKWHNNRENKNKR